MNSDQRFALKMLGLREPFQNGMTLWFTALGSLFVLTLTGVFLSIDKLKTLPIFFRADALGSLVLTVLAIVFVALAYVEFANLMSVHALISKLAERPYDFEPQVSASKDEGKHRQRYASLYWALGAASSSLAIICMLTAIAAMLCDARKVSNDHSVSGPASSSHRSG